LKIMQILLRFAEIFIPLFTELKIQNESGYIFRRTSLYNSSIGKFQMSCTLVTLVEVTT